MAFHYHELPDEALIFHSTLKALLILQRLEHVPCRTGKVLARPSTVGRKNRRPAHKVVVDEEFLLGNDRTGSDKSASGSQPPSLGPRWLTMEQWRNVFSVSKGLKLGLSAMFYIKVLLRNRVQNAVGLNHYKLFIIYTSSVDTLSVSTCW